MSIVPADMLSREPRAAAPRRAIPLCVPEIRGNEWRYVKECLDTNWVSSAGAFVDRFEKMVSGYVGARYAVATVNGTAGLHIALLVAGIQPDDEVVVSTLTFVAPANAIRYVGAWPVFVDADPDYWQMDPHKVTEFLHERCVWKRGELCNKLTNRRVRAILPVHILGHPVDMAPILEAAKKFELVVIEDATEGLGAKYRGRHVGTLGDIGCVSFNGNKIITAGGGGMIVTNNETWAERAKYLTTQAKDDPIESIHNEVGYNYRLTNLQAAVGCAQMEKLDDYIMTKRLIAGRYRTAMSEIPGIEAMTEASWACSIFWIFTMLVDELNYGTNSRCLLKQLGEFGIETRPLWQPLHLSPAHRGAFTADCTVAERIARDALSLPSSVGLTPTDQERVSEEIRKLGR